MNLLLTMNTGGTWIPDNVRRSHLAAASRWGCDYREIMSGAADPFREKHRHMAKVEAENVIWINGDCIVRHDCPSPITMAGQDFAGVSGLQGQDERSAEWAMSWHTSICKLGGSVRAFPAVYVNGGLLVSQAKHRALWGYVMGLSASVQGPLNPMVEQGIVNYALQAFDFRVQLLPFRYNLLGVEAWKPGPMTAFVQHLACVGELRENKREALEAIEWERAS